MKYILSHFQISQLWRKAVLDILAGSIRVLNYAVLYKQLCTLLLTTSKLKQAFHMSWILHEAADLVTQVHYSRSKWVASLKHVSCWGSPGSQNLVAEQPLNKSHGLACSCGSCGSQQIHQAQVHNTAHLPVKAYILVSLHASRKTVGDLASACSCGRYASQMLSGQMISLIWRLADLTACKIRQHVEQSIACAHVG